MTEYSQSTIDRAHAILDGVVQISENEQLIHGEYLTPYVVNEDLAKRGAICGGHQACLIGSVALSATRNPEQADNIIAVLNFAPRNLEDAFSENVKERIEESRKVLRNRVPLRLAMAALNAEAVDRLRRVRSVRRAEAREALDWENPAEGFFETYLNGLSQAATHRAIVSLVEGAKARVTA